MESNDQVIHCYPNDQGFKTSTEMVQNAIDTQTPLVAFCGDEWLPLQTGLLNGDPCPACAGRFPEIYRKVGVWFVYGWDMNAYPLVVFDDEIEARRWKDENAPNYGQVKFWRYGTEWSNK